jgi:hypothetical protein
MKDPFPIEKLSLLEFGSADGFKDKELENTFINTKFIQKFLQDNHSIIIGHMGTGKSALFKLLKEQSDKVGHYKDRTIVSIDETIPFNNLKNFANLLTDIDEKQLYQFIWKFQITQKIAEKISNFTSFPNNEPERLINDFLKLINSKDYNEPLIKKLKNLIQNAKFTLRTEVAHTPILIETSIKSNNSKEQHINLDKILKLCIKAVENRNKNDILVIIDKIDAFVAGEEYNTQRKYIEALLEIDDDLSISFPKIGRKIFLRSDLFARISYEVLGRDKVNDNTLKLKWNKNELIYFLATRIENALSKEDILDFNDVLYSSPIVQEIVKEGFLKNFIRFSKFIPIKIKKIFIDYNKLNKERHSSLKEELMKLTITKVFPRKLIHKNSNCQEEEITIFDFIETHFLNAHEEPSPRNILMFLKNVNDYASSYYEENLDQEVHIINNDNIPEWKLYKKNFIYKAYIESTEDFIKNISKTEDKWTKYFSTFLKKRKKKQVFDYKWMQQQTGLSEEDTIVFFAYLVYIGFLYISENHPDEKKRKYKLPIMYMPNCT